MATSHLHDEHDEHNDGRPRLTMSSQQHGSVYPGPSPIGSSVTLHDPTTYNTPNLSRNTSNAGRSTSGHLSPPPAQYATQYNDPFSTSDAQPTPKSAKSVTFTDRPASESTLYDKNGELSPIAPMKYREIRDSTHLIPTPPISDNKNKRFHPLALRLPIALGIPIMMIALGIALEIGLFLSMKNTGFSVPQKNAISFASQSFLLSIVPTLFVLPVAFTWRELDWYVRDLQPYVVMSKGNAKPEESLLLDYVQLGTLFSLINSLNFKHRLVFWSSFLAAATYLFQPLAGSIFSIQQLDRSWDSNVTSVKKIGLSPDIDSLSPFVAAAGFADAAAFNDLGDPPFILNGWAVAQYEFPTDSLLNGSMVVETTAIQSNPHCENSASQPTVTSNLDGSSNITATIANLSGRQGCVQNVTFNPNDDVQQYGVQAVGDCPGPSISNNASSDGNVRFSPVMFWYYSRDPSPQARVVFCAPTIAGFNVRASSSLKNNDLTKVEEINNYTTSNNVFGSDGNDGKAFNAVVFNSTGNRFIAARGSATNTGIPGTVFRLASQNGTLADTFNSANSFLDLTNRVYTQHLSLTAKSIYFVDDNSLKDAVKNELAPRLYINPLPGHALALLLIGVGIIGIFVQVFHRRQRRRLYLTNPPGTIASIIAMTSHSGVGQLLMPYDKERELEKKLKDLRFGMDKRTGAIVVDGYARPGDRQEGNSGRSSSYYYGGGGGGKGAYARVSTLGKPKDSSEARDEAMMSLLGQGTRRGSSQSGGGGSSLGVSDQSMYESSSRMALDAAAGHYPPTTGWRRN
ncbi:hypothetical protein K435DRAFT_778878 [Dendrothele bispora CBS 962.96]|uniref:Uncharacterized protein n=1 Tax=Dendrothele bispora (strain CBS 962.96) TaxID=1314807 RepID=A0A4S8M0W1_DENBC|nr:hypothetical protein K435DRAFT_778878 [Dendrothele bispora CBS 962.96]